MSIDAIRAKLLPRFVTSARERIAKARAAVAAGDPGIVRGELHAITGDAGMIGQPAIADAARAASVHARGWEAGDAAAREACEAALGALDAMLVALAPA